MINFSKLLIHCLCLIILLFFQTIFAQSTVVSCKINQPPKFTIKSLPLPAFNTFSKYMCVFGVSIYATSEVDDIKMLHAANILAQYLDNNAHGKPDNMKVIKQMLKNHATLVMFKDPDSLKMKHFFDTEHPDGMTVQILLSDLTYLKNGQNGHFDVSLEEVLHLITHAGYAFAYPSVFGENKYSQIGKAMNKARGGYFEHVPNHYPEDAWYTYDDETCEYDCQVAEYTYWLITSLLGAQDFPGRYQEIKNEWRLNTAKKVKQGDKKAYAIISNPIYKIPTKLPNGHYQIKS